MAHPNPEIRAMFRKMYREHQEDFERVEIYHGANRKLAIYIRETAGIPPPKRAADVEP